MRLRTRLLIIIGAVWLLFIGIVYLGANLYLLKNIKVHEKSEFDANFLRIYKSIDQYLYTLGTFTSDWGYWNDAYNYVDGINPGFVSENINLAVLNNSNINLLMYLNKQGNILIGMMTDMGNQKFVSYPLGLENYIYPGSMFERHTEAIKNTKGLVYVNNSILLVASAAVANTNINRPINGVVITGRYFTEKLLKSIENDLALSLSLILPNEFSKDKHINPVIDNSIKNGEDQYVIFVSNKLAYGYAVLRDIYKKPIGIIQVKLPRTSYASGLKAIHYYLTMLFFSGLILCVLIWYLLKIFILNRVENLTRQIQNIDIKKDYSERLSVDYHDEFLSLSEHFNKLMDTVQKSNEKTEDHIRQLVVSQNRLENMNKKLINEVNERKQAEAKAKSLNDILVLASRKAGMADIASGVLSNVGSMFNKILDSITLIKERLKNKSTASQDDQYIMHEIGIIEKNSDQMKNVILMQSSLGGVIEIFEEVKLSRIIEDALMLNKTIYKKYGIKVIKDFKFNDNVVIDKVKLLHILVNTMKYVIDLLAASHVEKKVMTISTSRFDQTQFVVRLGYMSEEIFAENINKITALGLNDTYTEDNFGIQTSIRFSKDMGGSLSMENIDAGQGTAFVIVLPMVPRGS